MRVRHSETRLLDSLLDSLPFFLEAKSIRSRKDAFNLFYSSEMKSLTVAYTDHNIHQKMLGKGKTESKSLTVAELHALFALSIYRGFRNWNRTYINDLYHSSELNKVDMVSGLMSRDRYKSILSS